MPRRARSPGKLMELALLVLLALATTVAETELIRREVVALRMHRVLEARRSGDGSALGDGLRGGALGDGCYRWPSADACTIGSLARGTSVLAQYWKDDRARVVSKTILA